LLHGLPLVAMPLSISRPIHVTSRRQGVPSAGCARGLARVRVCPIASACGAVLVIGVIPSGSAAADRVLRVRSLVGAQTVGVQRAGGQRGAEQFDEGAGTP
jgi:hypothetical protein